MKRLYIAGPMTGIDNYNFPAFDAARDQLKSLGYEPVSPADIDRAAGRVTVWADGTVELADDFDYEETLAADHKVIESCDGIVLLPGSEHSNGARSEWEHACALGLPVYALIQDYAWPLVPFDARALMADPPAATTEGEERITSSTGGQKGRKLARFDLLPWGALTKVAEHYGRGAAKYDDHNWRKGYEWSLSVGALGRHLAAFMEGEDNDPETGSPHMAAVAFHALSLLTFMNEHPELDDRFAP